MVLFSEKQRFRQWWFWLILLFPFATNIWNNYTEKQTFQIDFTTIYSVAFLMILIIFLFFWIMSLKTEITTEGVSVQFFPFHRKPRFFPWQDMESINVRKYKPLLEYGGWGLRVGLFGKGTAYNVSGNMGIQLEFKNNKKLLIGTQRPEEASIALQKIGKFSQGNIE